MLALHGRSTRARSDSSLHACERFGAGDRSASAYAPRGPILAPISTHSPAPPQAPGAGDTRDIGRASLAPIDVRGGTWRGALRGRRAPCSAARCCIARRATCSATGCAATATGRGAPKRAAGAGRMTCRLLVAARSSGGPRGDGRGGAAHIRADHACPRTVAPRDGGRRRADARRRPHLLRRRADPRHRRDPADGALVAMDAETLEIDYASANCAGLFRP